MLKDGCQDPPPVTRALSVERPMFSEGYTLLCMNPLSRHCFCPPYIVLREGPAPQHNFVVTAAGAVWLWGVLPGNRACPRRCQSHVGQHGRWVGLCRDGDSRVAQATALGEKCDSPG